MNPLLFVISVISIATLVDAFLAISSVDRTNIYRYQRFHSNRIHYTRLHSSLDIQPHAPQSTIKPEALLSQVHNLLTLKDIKNILRSRAKISGNRDDLLLELGRLLGTNDDDNPVSIQQSTRHNLKGKIHADTQKKNYKRMTVKELRNELRHRGGKVSGRKTELIQRLMDADACSEKWDDFVNEEHNNTGSEDWSVLDATISQVNYTTNLLDEAELELPILSSLLFVNKPCGMSTLPTREVAGYPSFPCLSDLVKDWLFTNPDGTKLMTIAANNEEQFWNCTLTSNVAANANLLKKKQRQREKLLAKESTFEPRPVHRLDIDTSGIVCIALTPYALRTAGMLFEQKSRQSGDTESTENVYKRYTALVKGKLKASDKEISISHGIGKIWLQDIPQSAAVGHHEWACDILDNESIAFCRPGDEAIPSPLRFVDGSVRNALTSYTVVDITRTNVTRVELTPHTGRGHQLRLHMAAIGHPIVGDSMHGSSRQKVSVPEEGKLHLHASNLSLDCWKLTNGSVQRCRADISSTPWF